jgi:hypothetical protein
LRPALDAEKKEGTVKPRGKKEKKKEKKKEQTSSTVIKREVFLTELMIVLRSRGRIVRKLITSTEIPFFSRRAAASIDLPTAREKVTNVMSLPIKRDVKELSDREPEAKKRSQHKNTNLRVGSSLYQ